MEADAGHLAEVHGLKGLDAIHLSAAKLLAASEEAPSVDFSSFDERLNAAASAEGLNLLLPR